MPFFFDARLSERICRLADEIVAAGGTPSITISRRTPRAVVEELRSKRPASAHPAAANNSYLALLGLADGFIVTGDSVSMMAEVVRARKPLAILDVPLGRFGAIDQWR